MSLLRQDSGQIDDAARGEEFTKGTSHVVWAAAAAAVVVTAAIAIYVLVGQKPPAATGEIEQVVAHPQHTVTPAFDANGAPMPQESFDQVLVFTKVKLHNQSKEPLFLYQIAANATLDDGIHTSYAATKSEYDRVFIAYPALVSLRTDALSQETTIAPGQTVEGTFVSAFRMGQQQWDARKDLNYSFGFQYHPSLVLTPRTVTDQ